ncbi:MAG: helix-turn-helix domain-containing protein [Clostridia bacterium]|nr:helix-turn-helix domain-containing protein [Clostridia bacterium]
MNKLLLDFNELPKIGFAHHFKAENYNHSYFPREDNFEIVYVKKGRITVEIWGGNFVAEEGSVFLLFRNHPINIISSDKGTHSHCSVQLIMDYTAALSEDVPEDFAGLVLPLYVPASEVTERIKRELYSIVSDIGVSREHRGAHASLIAVGILRALSELRITDNKSSIVSYMIKRYISEHLGEKILLSDISAHLKKTPNYLNSVFKAANGINIHQYVTAERIKTISELMLNKGLSFKVSCESVGIYDVSYGYRLFKKHTGLTPSEYSSGNLFDYPPLNKK